MKHYLKFSLVLFVFLLVGGLVIQIVAQEDPVDPEIPKFEDEDDFVNFISNKGDYNLGKMLDEWTVKSTEVLLSKLDQAQFEDFYDIVVSNGKLQELLKVKLAEFEGEITISGRTGDIKKGKAHNIFLGIHLMNMGRLREQRGGFRDLRAKYGDLGVVVDIPLDSFNVAEDGHTIVFDNTASFDLSNPTVEYLMVGLRYVPDRKPSVDGKEGDLIPGEGVLEYDFANNWQKDLADLEGERLQTTTIGLRQGSLVDGRMYKGYEEIRDSGFESKLQGRREEGKNFNIITERFKGSLDPEGIPKGVLNLNYRDSLGLVQPIDFSQSRGGYIEVAEFKDDRGIVEGFGFRMAHSDEEYRNGDYSLLRVGRGGTLVSPGKISEGGYEGSFVINPSHMNLFTQIDNMGILYRDRWGTQFMEMREGKPSVGPEGSGADLESSQRWLQIKSQVGNTRLYDQNIPAPKLTSSGTTKIEGGQIHSSTSVSVPATFPSPDAPAIDTSAYLQGFDTPSTFNEGDYISESRVYSGAPIEGAGINSISSEIPKTPPIRGYGDILRGRGPFISHVPSGNVNYGGRPGYYRGRGRRRPILSFFGRLFGRWR